MLASDKGMIESFIIHEKNKKVNIYVQTAIYHFHLFFDRVLKLTTPTSWSYQIRLVKSTHILLAKASC